MAKRSHRGLSKKGLVGLTRITVTDEDGKRKRFWKYRDREYLTLREVIIHNRLDQLALK